MKLTLRRSLVVLLAVAAPWAATAADPFSDPAIEKAVLAANTEMVAAANRLDLDAFFDAILDTDRGMIVQNGVVFPTRADARAAVERGTRGITAIDRRFNNPKVTVISPETALLVSEGSVTATLQEGRVIEARFAVSLIFVLREGRWMLLHGHYSAPQASM